MGFWHTGYIEFHEPQGLDDFSFDQSPTRYPCAECGKVFGSLEDLRQHRFESHPLRRPMLFVEDRELGAHSIRITKAHSPEDWRVDGADRSILNGKEVPLAALPERLAEFSSDVCRIELIGAEVSVQFTLDFCLASEDDLLGIDVEFAKLARSGRLDIRAVDEFITATSEFHTAIGYCDGICAYLYGVLAKEKAPDSSLPYEAYVTKFTKAAAELAAYNRSLARTIGGLIEFHFNHFEDAVSLARHTRAGRSATRYAAWISGRSLRHCASSVDDAYVRQLEPWVTDWDTEHICRWASRPLTKLLRDAGEMESFLGRDIAEYDKVKLHVLLGETYAACGDRERAIGHARTLRNQPELEGWAESMIRRHVGDRNERH